MDISCCVVSSMLYLNLMVPHHVIDGLHITSSKLLSCKLRVIVSNLGMICYTTDHAFVPNLWSFK